MQLVCKRRHTAFVVANGGRELLRKGDDLRYANALPELFVEGGQQPNHGGSLHIGKGILNPFLREDMLHTPVVISSVGTGKRRCILRKLYHMARYPSPYGAESVSGWSRSTRTFRQSFRRFTPTLKSSGPFTTTFMKCSMSRSGSRHNCTAAKPK